MQVLYPVRPQVVLVEPSEMLLLVADHVLQPLHQSRFLLVELVHVLGLVCKGEGGVQL